MTTKIRHPLPPRFNLLSDIAVRLYAKSSTGFKIKQHTKLVEASDVCNRKAGDNPSVRHAASSGLMALSKVESHEYEILCRLPFPLRMRFNRARIGRCGLSCIHC